MMNDALIRPLPSVGGDIKGFNQARRHLLSVQPETCLGLVEVARDQLVGGQFGGAMFIACVRQQTTIFHNLAIRLKVDTLIVQAMSERLLAATVVPVRAACLDALLTLLIGNPDNVQVSFWNNDLAGLPNGVCSAD